jgi:hypothetical protein
MSNHEFHSFEMSAKPMSKRFFIDEQPGSSLAEYTGKATERNSYSHCRRGWRAVRCAVESLETRRLLSSGVQNLFPTRQYNVGANPVAIAVADLNGDGRSDIVTANNSSDSLTVLLSGAGGVFTSSTYSLAGDPQNIAIGDINGDGKPDLIVTTSTPMGGAAANNISVLLGNGSGGFGLPTNYPLTGAPTSLALGDFNGDGHLDVAVAAGGQVGIALNTGNGTLATPSYYGINNGEADQIAVGNIAGHGRPDIVAADEENNTVYVMADQSNGILATPVAYSVPNYIGAIAIADVNGDGKVDVVTSGAVLLGNGSGLSGATISGLSGGYPFAIGDFNGDGHPDVVAISQQNGGEYVQLNGGAGTFAPGIHLAVGNSSNTSTSAIAVGDFNGDGKLDTVTADSDSGTISIQLGEGNGSLAPVSQQVFVGGVPNAIVAADFNGDGHLDLATANGQISGQGDTITVLTNNGSASFPSYATYTVGNDPRAIVVGDFNGDGKPDLAVANYDDDTVSILLNLGNGEFAAPVNYAVGKGPISLAVGDFNGDGRTDIVVADYESPEVDLLLNKGGGAFLNAIPYMLNDNPDSVAVGDFNGDGYPDIATASYSGDDVEVLTNSGHGGFGPAVSYPIGSAAASIVAADFNGDSKTDLAVTTGSSGVDVLLANSSGGFAAASSVFTGPASELTVGDLNGDSKPDLIVAQNDSSYSGSLAVLLGTGSGTFASPVDYSSSSQAQAAVVGDFNGDGKADVAIATASYGAGGIAMFLGRGSGVLDAPMLYTASGVDPYEVATGDFNNDGHLDLVTANYQNSTVSVFLNNGFGTLEVPQTYSVGTGPNSVAVGDFNDDGLPDIVTANYLDDTVTILINNGDGFNAPETVSVGQGPISVVTGDFNHDGYSDIAVANALDSTITVLMNNRAGGFTTATENLSAAPSSLAIGDVNDDGYADLVATSVAGNKVFVLRNSGTGIFTTVASYTSPEPLTGPLVVGDLNGDGRSDVVAASYDSATYSDAVSVFLANANGTLAAGTTYDVTDNSALLLADMNGDGNLDLITPAGFNSDRVAVQLGSGTGTFGTAHTFDVGITASTLAAGDFDGDGKADVVVGYAAYFGSAIALAFGNGTGGLLSATSQGLSDSLLSLTAGDFNNDGVPDLVTRNSSAGGNSSYSVLLNSNDGSFYSSETFTLPGDPTADAVGDFNGDGNLDLAFIEPASGGGNNLLVLLGNGDGTFQAPLVYSAGNGDDPDSIAVGDFNGDGKLDLAVANYDSGNVTILLNNGTGGFTVGNTLTVGTNPADIIAADFNNDGKLDLAVANEGSDNISILLATGSGNFAAAHNITVPDAPTQIVAADFNGDGKPDLAVIGDAILGGSDNHLYTLLNLGSGNFATPLAYTLDSAATSLAVGDFNGDSKPDIAVSSYSDDDVQILLNSGSGTFLSSQDYTVGSAPGKIVASDFNSDSMSDVAVASYGGVSVLENQFDGIAPVVSGNTFAVPADRTQNLTFTVSFTDNVNFNAASIHTGSLSVIWPDGTTVIPTFVSVNSPNAKNATATFTLAAPFSEAGLYTLKLVAGGIADAAGNLGVAANIATFMEIFGTSVPAASLSPVTSPTTGQTAVQFTVIYTDTSSDINAATLGNANIIVINPALDFSAGATLVSDSPILNGFQVIYQVVAPDGTFNSDDNGTYQISLQGNSVSSNAGVFIVGETLGSFTVNLAVPPPPDTTAPTASASGFNAPSTGESSLTFSVTYTDNNAVNASSINADTVAITLPDGTSVSPTILSTSGSGTSITVSYSYTPADGAFSSGDNGTYTLNLLAGGFSDTSGNPAAAATLGSFTVNLAVPPPSDTTAPTASASGFNAPSTGASSVTFFVTYTDNVAVNASSINSGTIDITLPDGTSVSPTILSTTGSGASITVSYFYTPVDGAFASSDNGTYTLNLLSGGFTDASGNPAAAATLGSFNLNLSAPPIVDNTPPTASLAPVSPPVSDQKIVQFTVTYTDEVGGSGVAASTFGNDNITVSGPDYSQAASLISVTATSDGFAVDYQIVAPNAFFSQYANGTYQINLNATSVSDNAGNFAAAQTLGTFTVNISPPAPAPDLTGTISAPTTSVLPGSKKNAYSVTIANIGNATVNAKVPVVIYASPTSTYDASTAINLGSISEKLKLAAGGSKAFKLNFVAPPAIANGNYYLIAVVDPDNTISEQYKSNNTFASSSSTAFEAPAVDLALKMAPPAKNGVIKLTVTNTTASNVLATGGASLNLYDSDDDSTLQQLLTSIPEKISLKVGASKSFSVKLPANAVSGDYLGAMLTFNGSPADSNSANNIAFSATPIS